MQDMDSTATGFTESEMLIIHLEDLNMTST
jgi:hypothetical protein